MAPTTYGSLGHFPWTQFLLQQPEAEQGANGRGQEMQVPADNMQLTTSCYGLNVSL